MATMLAARLHDIGKPMQLEEIEVPHPRPNDVVVRVADDGLHLRLCRDAFPAAPNVEFYDVVFPAELFEGPEFDTATVGDYLVASRR